MEHLVLPTSISGLKDLETEIKTKNLAMGSTSPIKNLLIEKVINFDNDLAKLDTAATHDHSASMLRKIGKAKLAVSHNKSGGVMKKMAGIAQLIKSINKKELSVVGTWGFDITLTGKISYPTDIAEQKQLVLDVEEKNDEYASNTSPIAQYLLDKEIVFTKLSDDLDDAATFEQHSKTAYDQSEAETADRDAEMKPVIDHVTLIGNFLMEYYKGDQKQLGLWGFTVNESSGKPVEQTTKIKLLDKKTLTSVKVGGHVTNAGSDDIHIYKGKTTTGNPIILHPGDTWGVPKKHSTITISNPSELQTAIVKVLVTKS